MMNFNVEIQKRKPGSYSPADRLCSVGASNIRIDGVTQFPIRKTPARWTGG